LVLLQLQLRRISLKIHLIQIAIPTDDENTWLSLYTLYRVSQNSRILNSERGREGPSGARKILRKKKIALPEEDISTLILFNT
jgi:hypothetical protein